MNILIAVDGSKHTQKALDYLVKHRETFVDKHQLVVAHVCVGITANAARHLSKEVLKEHYSDESSKVIGPVKAFLESKQITNFRVEERHGHVAEEILKAATAAQAELIVLGTHGHGIFGRALMGSVATKVVAETDITVLLVQ